MTIVWWTNPLGEVDGDSPSWLAFTGQRPSESKGRGWLEAIHPEDRARVASAWQELAAESTYRSVECRIMRHDGSWRRVMLEGSPLLEGDGTLRGCVGTCSEILRVEDLAPAPSSEPQGLQDRGQLRAVLQAMDDVVLLFDMSGRIVFVNEAAARWLGFPSLQAMLDHPARPALGALNGPGDPLLAHDFELQYPDGTVVPLEDWPSVRTIRGETLLRRVLVVRSRKGDKQIVVSANSTPVRDEHGNQIFALMVYRDITKEKEAEEALRESEMRFRTLADNIAQMAWMADAQGKALWCNRRWVDYTGMEAADMARFGLGPIIHPDHLADAKARSVQIQASGEPLDETYAIRGKDGNYRWFLVRGTPIRDDAGKVFRWFGTCTDITEQRRIADELREADRRKNEFLGVLSHELRNPLAPISNSVVLLDMASPGSPSSIRAKEVIRRQTEHLVRLVDELLDVSRIARGKVDLRRELIDLREIVSSTCEDHSSLFVNRELYMGIELPPAPVWVEADPLRMSQVVWNLIHNAAKFSPRGGRVDVTVAASTTRAKIAVRDSGVGIAPRDLERLFEPFAQAEQNLARTEGGLGLGLSLVKGFVELHGGSARARSEGTGKGAEFLIELPLAEREKAEAV